MPSMDQNTTIVCRGSLTISRASFFLRAIASAISRHSAVMIDCTDAADVDVTFLQILISARRTAEAQGKRIELTAPSDGVLVTALERLGISLSHLSTAPLAAAQ
ncbi:MAG: lipid asymmetry maintenance protein MlaB [Methylovirgula sp.]